MTGDEEDGWAGTILVEPLTALAGGILGGTFVAVLVWRRVWRHALRTDNTRGVPA